MKPGPKPINDEQRRLARRAHKAKIKNISVDADLVEMINRISDKLVEPLGFRPTVSQTLRYLIKHEIKP
jgi:hypothetical protein